AGEPGLGGLAQSRAARAESAAAVEFARRVGTPCLRRRERRERLADLPATAPVVGPGACGRGAVALASVAARALALMPQLDAGRRPPAPAGGRVTLVLHGSSDLLCRGGAGEPAPAVSLVGLGHYSDRDWPASWPTPALDRTVTRKCSG